MNLTYKSSIKHNEGIAKCSNLDPLITNGSPLQSDIKRQSSDNSFTTPAIMKEIESLLGINEHALCVHNFKIP